jgi:hypothetical protein
MSSVLLGMFRKMFKPREKKGEALSPSPLLATAVAAGAQQPAPIAYREYHDNVSETTMMKIGASLEWHGKDGSSNSC